MLNALKIALSAIMKLWGAVPDSIKEKTVEAAFSLIEHLVRAFFRSKQSQGKEKSDGNV